MHPVGYGCVLAKNVSSNGFSCVLDYQVDFSRCVCEDYITVDHAVDLSLW